MNKMLKLAKRDYKVGDKQAYVTESGRVRAMCHGHFCDEVYKSEVLGTKEKGLGPSGEEKL